MNTIAPEQQRATIGDWFVPPFLALGGFFIPLIGWLIACYFLWRSPTWTRREKLIGTLAIPGGAWTFFFAVLLLGTTSSANEPAPANTALTALLIAMIAAQAISLVVLWRRTWIQR